VISAFATWLGDGPLLLNSSMVRQVSPGAHSRRSGSQANAIAIDPLASLCDG
jgi:hypothetical protein